MGSVDLSSEPTRPYATLNTVDTGILSVVHSIQWLPAGPYIA